MRLHTLNERRLIRAVGRGQAFRPERPCRVRIGVLRKLLLGGYGNVLAPPPKIMIDGTAGGPVTILDDDDNDVEAIRLLDLSHLTAQGGALPALSLRGCRIVGVLDISGSEFAGFQLRNCSMRGLLGDGCQIGNNLKIDAVRPLAVGISPAPDAQIQCCTIRLIAARIDGALEVHNSLLVAPGAVDFPKADAGQRRLRDPQSPGHHANTYALSIAASEIGGRVWIRNDVLAFGGISIFQAIIRNSFRMEAGLLYAGPELDRSSSEAQAGRSLAFSGEEAQIGGSFLWGTPERERTASDLGNRVFGRISMVRARIESDVVFERCTSIASGSTLEAVLQPMPDWRRVGTLERPGATLNAGDVSCADRVNGASGGIDLRRATISGQLSFHADCLIGRRAAPVSRRRSIDWFGSAVDAWKAEISLGVLIDAQARFLGPVHLNSCVMGRETIIAGSIDFFDERAILLPFQRGERWFGPYHIALTLSDARIAGFVCFDLAASGRVILERLEVQGSVEFRRLAFDKLTSAEQRDPTRPFEETSILDMQDLRVAGGVNLKRGSVGVAPIASVPFADKNVDPSDRDGLIVDMRGMSCTTWDDADGTCWSGLVYPRPLLPFANRRRSATLWRLRFEGLTIQRIDSSRQRQPLDPSITTYHHRLEKIGNAFPPIRRVLARIASTPKMDNWARRLRRTYHVVSQRDAAAYRVQALESYHFNKPLRGLMPAPLAALWRWTFQPSWHRRERIPTFSPQPFDEFARAYSARGDIEVAVAITIRRMELQWHRYLRQFTQFWSTVVLLPSLIAMIISVRRDNPLFMWFCGTALVSPLILAALLFLFRYGFGFGLRARNAVATTTLFLLLVGLGLPSGIVLTLSPEAAIRVPEHVRPSAHYALDKLLPLDMKQKEEIDEKIGEDIKKAQKACHQMGRLAESRSVGHLDDADTPCPPKDALDRERRRFRRVNDALDVAGWILTSLLILTLSGVLRRDIERR